MCYLYCYIYGDSILRYKQLQLDIQSSLASLQRTKDDIEEFTSIKLECDQVIVRLSTDVLKAKSKSVDGAMEAIEAALADLSQIKGQAEDLLNSIVAMETLVSYQYNRIIFWMRVCL